MINPFLSIFVTSLLIASMFTAPASNAWSVTQESVSVFSGTLDEAALSIAVDASGNIYTTGIFGGTVDFDPGAGTANLTAVGNIDVFISKLNSSGNLVWAKSFGGSSYDYGNAIAVDASANIYTTGSFASTVDFDPGAGTANLTAVGSGDVFISKLNSSGNFVWAKSFGGNSSEHGLSIALDSTGNVFTAGEFSGTADFDPGEGTSNLVSNRNSDVFISKLNSSGTYVWAKSFGGNERDVGVSIGVDGFGNVYTTGQFEGEVDFDPGEEIANITSMGRADVFVSKLDSFGAYIWAKSLGGTGGDYAVAITVDHSGNIYTTGNFYDTADFDPGEGTANLSATDSDVFISKLDSSGAYMWAKNFGDYPNAIKVDSSGNVYSTGYFYDTQDFDSGEGTANLTAVGSNDVFISKLNSSGNLVWAKSIGGTDSDSGLSIAVDSSGNIYTTGVFNGTADFDPGAGTLNITSLGGEDVFVLKLNSLGLAVVPPKSDDSAEKARRAEAEAEAQRQRELTEILGIIPSIAGLALNIGALTNELLGVPKSSSTKQKCVKGTKTTYVKKGAKCPAGYKKKK